MLRIRIIVRIHIGGIEQTLVQRHARVLRGFMADHNDLRNLLLFGRFAVEVYCDWELTI